MCFVVEVVLVGIVGFGGDGCLVDVGVMVGGGYGVEGVFGL